MRVGYFDCFAGISGDMILGALIDAGMDVTYLKEQLSLLPISGYVLQEKKVFKHGIAGTKVDVICVEENMHRSLQDIKVIINESSLPPEVKDKSIRIFTRLAEAEAKVQQKNIAEIHFYEVGAVDAIVDVVGSVIGLQVLQVDKFYASSLRTGKGFVKCAHGLLPIPAPATLELLRGIPVYSGEIEMEFVTPTGAAVLAEYCQDFGAMPLMKVDKIGYGAGESDTEIPNYVRLHIGELATDVLITGDISVKDHVLYSTKKAKTEGADSKDLISFKEDRRFDTCDEAQYSQAYIIEANIDDMNPEIYDHLISLLLQAGAMDVFLQDIQMKKNRPAQILSVMIDPSQLRKMSALIFNETSTIGMRVRAVTKIMLPYQIIEVETNYGKARVKVAYHDNEISNLKPEYEDCRLLARTCQIPLKRVYEEVKKEAYRILGNN